MRAVASKLARSCLTRVALEGAVMIARTTPEDGDIVVREEIRGATPAHLLRMALGADQYEFRRRDSAIARGAPDG